MVVFMKRNKIEKDKYKRYRYIQTLVSPTMHKDLRKLAIEKDITLTELIKEIIEVYFAGGKRKEVKTV